MTQSCCTESHSRLHLPRSFVSGLSAFASCRQAHSPCGRDIWRVRNIPHPGTDCRCRMYDNRSQARNHHSRRPLRCQRPSHFRICVYGSRQTTFSGLEASSHRDSCLHFPRPCGTTDWRRARPYIGHSIPPGIRMCSDLVR